MANTLTAPQYIQDTWPPPNFVNPETRGNSLEYISIAFSAFGLVVVLLRCYSRIFLTRAFGLDDALIIAALALCIGLAILLIIGIEKWYLGYHIWDLPAHSVVDHRKGMWMATYVNICASCCIRVSILLFYRRLSVSFTKGFLLATWIGIAYNVCIMVALCLANTLICWPVQSYWLRYDSNWRTSHKWKCGNEGISLPTAGVLTIIGDIYCTVLPLVLIMTLKIPRNQKFALYSLFGLGFLACGAAIARVTYLSWTVLRTWDFTWMIYDVWIWNSVELFIGIFAASAPALRPLVRQIIRSDLLGYTYRYGTRHSRTSVSNAQTAHVTSGTEGRSSKQWHIVNASSNMSYHDKTSISRQDRTRSAEKEIQRPQSATTSSTRSSLDCDRTSTESFPPRKAKDSRQSTTDCQVIEQDCGNEKSFSLPDIEVDPPIYPAAVMQKPTLRPTKQTSQDRLTSQRTTLVSNDGYPKMVPAIHDPGSMSAESSPLPISDLYLTERGWVELRPGNNSNHRGSKEIIPGSVGAAPFRTGAQTQSSNLHPSSSGLRKAYYDAESSHHAEISFTPLPRSTPQPANRSSADLTRVDYSDGSDRASANDLGHFQLDLSVKDSDSSVTALPQRDGRR